MSSVSKISKSPYWFARFRLGNGRRTTRSTKLTDRKKAQALARQWEDAASGQRSVQHIQKVMSEVYKEATGRSVQGKNVREYLSQWLEGKRPGLATSTSDKYGYCVAEFLHFLGERADEPLLHICEHDLTSFRDASATQGRAKTTNNKLVTIASAFREAWMDGLIPDDIGKRLKRLKLRAEKDCLERLPFTQEQVDSIINHAEGEWKGIATFGAYSGQRLGDIVQLQWKNIHPTLFAFESRKTHRVMRVPLHPTVKAWLISRPGKHLPNEPLFPESYATLMRNKGRASPLSKQFRALLAKLGFATKTQWRVLGKGRKGTRSFSPLSFHSFRHYLTSQLHQAGVSAAVVRDIIGHDSVAVNRLYTDIDDQTKILGIQTFVTRSNAAASMALETAKPVEACHE